MDGETIAAVLNPGSTLLGVDLEQNADSVVDAAGKYVIPGGITPTPTWNCRSAAPRPPTPSRPALERRVGRYDDDHRLRCAALRRAGEDGWHAKAAGNACVDYGFHQIIGGVDEFSLKAMDALIDEGVTSFKLFMAYPGVFYSDDAQILKAMQKSAETGLLTMMHAENGPAIDVLAEQLYSAGNTCRTTTGLRPQMEEEATTARS